MTRGILIVGNESALTRSIETETSNRVDKYAVALITNRVSGAQRNTSQEKGRMPLDWNPSSPISARALALAAQNRLDNIDTAILICTPPSIRSSAPDIPLSDIEIMINDQIKGWFFLIKEITAIFSARKHGTLALVYPDISGSGKDDVADVFGPSALASFRALTHGLLSVAHSEPYITMGFSASDAGNETAFASFIYKSLDDITKRSNGKLHKYGRFSFFK